MDYCGSKNDTSPQLWSAVRLFFKILHNGRGQEVYGNYINAFCEKNII